VDRGRARACADSGLPRREGVAAGRAPPAAAAGSLSSSAAWPFCCSSLRTGSRGERSSLGSLASACAVSQHPAVAGIQAEPAPPGAVPQARVGMPSALFGRRVISCESPGLPRPIPSPGRSSAGMAAVPRSPGLRSPERTGARPSPALLVCSSRSQSPSPGWDARAPCSGRLGLPICICGQVALLGESEPPTEREHAGTEVRFSQGKARGGVTEAAEEGSGARQDGQDEEAEAEEEDRAREVAAAGVDRAPGPVWRCTESVRAVTRPR